MASKIFFERFLKSGHYIVPHYGSTSKKVRKIFWQWATHEWPLFKFGLKNFFQAKFGLELFFQAKNGFKNFFREIFEKWPLHCATLWIHFKKGPKNFLTVGHSWVATFQIWLEKFFSSQIWLRIIFPSQKWLQKIFSRDFWKVATPLCHTMDPLQKRSEKFFDSGPLMSW